MHRIVLWSAVACAFGIAGIERASAEDYVLRVEELVYSEAKFADVKRLYEVGSSTEKPTAADAPQGKVAQSVKVRVTPNVPFKSETKIGETTVTISGTLTPASEPGRFELNVLRQTEGVSQKIIPAGGKPTEARPSSTVALRLGIDAEKPVHYGPVAKSPAAGKKTLPSTKGTFVVNTFRLEPVEAGE